MAMGTPPGTDADATTDLEVAFGSTRHLPAYLDIPEAYRRWWTRDGGAAFYHRWAAHLFYGTPAPDGRVQYTGDVPEEEMTRRIRAILSSFEPKHEHKMAGVAWLLRQNWPITPKERAA